ncbi:exo-alpha-sialidase [Spirosoma taeanense]|uniref:Exo-alpha-sialidase n=1 Tax=Spirosoma taeanense TaxID=2735870 RepID=A0A6M5YCR4_9BACT|nr:sialidase family protein [Spirosoma taeanense]QJW91021.1 exo-alpha-sialidase [Spirosoma taeanense]
MKSLITFLLAGLTGLLEPSSVRQTTVSDANFVGATPRLTTDAAGNPLLSWVEKQDDKHASFCFAVMNSNSGSGTGPAFGPKIRVKTPVSFSVHAEGMPKIATKKDGTLLAVFEVPRPTPDSRFAGDLLYVLSTNGGRTWTEPRPVHQNTAPGTSHSFADITRLPNGEIGIVWLDEKMPGKEGRPVKFMQTKPGGGFTDELIVDENACQCCRTNVFVDAQQRIHLTYRDMLPAKPGEIAARDISHVVSSDGGRTFTQPKAVYADNWQVNACPHAGPSVAQVGSDVLVTWFSGKEEAVGLRLARLGTKQLVADHLSARARHPQVAAAGEKLVWVWDEAISTDGSNQMGTFKHRIGMQSFVGLKSGPIKYLTPETVNATYPAVLFTRHGLLIAYEQVTGEQKAVITVQLSEIQ